MKTTLSLTETDIQALKQINESCSSADWKTTWMAKVEEIARREHVSMAEVMAAFAPHDGVAVAL